MNGLVFAAALSAVIIFGGSAIATKIAVSAISAIDVSIMRTVIGGLVALPLAYALHIPLPAKTSQKYLLLVSGFCGFIAFPLLFTLGVNLTTANHATMILAILPVLTGAIAQFWDCQRPRAGWWLGCAIAFAGETLLLYDPAAVDGLASVEGDLLIWISTLFASLGYVSGARLQRSGYSARGTSFWGVGLFALLLLPTLPLAVNLDALADAGLYAWSGLMYQAVGVTVVAYILWYWALGTGGIARVGLFQFLQPVSGIVLAWMILAENISLIFLLASSIIMVGVFLAFRAR
ncbi:MAG TPA: DMT family transporter [Gammaproteobacteria bacterium]|nr:DMT family transporter [Gammaproteobacteria bacterium]